jgi:4-hydroxy-4-methyl-2-oxoglutarate aldolase
MGSVGDLLDLGNAQVVLVALVCAASFPSSEWVVSPYRVKRVRIRSRSRNSSKRSASAVEGLKSSDLVDAMGRLHRHRCDLLDLVSPTPGRVLFGPAVTISYFPTCTAGLDPKRYNLANLFYEAVGDDPEGKVVVLASNGHPDVSMGGGTKLMRLQRHGCAGVLTDGRLRDFDELARYEFASYCSGEATRWGGDVVTPFQANVPVVLGGVGVMPGFYVFADSAGGVVIPDGQLDEVLAGARQVESDDARYRERIAHEDPSSRGDGSER